MTTTPSKKDIEDDTAILKAARKPKVRFESGLSDDDPDSHGEEPVNEVDEKNPTKKQSSNCGVSGRIQKRKMPVRRPTAYVSSKSSSRTKDDDELVVTDTPETEANNTNKSLNLEKRLDQLSVKYRKQDRSPEKCDQKSIKNSRVLKNK